jgi:acylphosphatase
MTAIGHRFLVAGRVQGVGFRWFVWRKAQALGVTGWARNLPDGRVEVEAHGSIESLEALAVALKTGPPASRVESVERTDIPHQSDTPKSFTTM